MLRFLTAGESHGPMLVTIVEGLPAGLEVSPDGLAQALARRRLGFGRSHRMEIEMDRLEIVGGVRFGATIGAPVAVLVHNTEWPRWEEEMAPAGVGPSDRPLRSPRPGHADLAGMLKYDTRDARDILERASARETAARTVAGHLAATLLAEIGIEVISHVVAIGGVTAAGSPEPADRTAIDASPVRVFDRTAEAAMVAAIDAARADRDSLGGEIEVLGFGVPAGFGSHSEWDRRLDAALGAAMMSIPSVKAVGVGDGADLARRRGSESHDEIHHGAMGFYRTTQRSGGVEGGMSTGETIRVRVAAKPLSTLMRPLATVDVVTKEPTVAFRERSDVCAVPATGVVAEHMMNWVLAVEAVRQFGGDTVTDFGRAAAAYRQRLAGF